ncbi:MAG: HNH endonuclease [Rhizobiaceae bacterium]|nr:HNH endonuclease [Rhizobiaceae bacterium]
MNRREFSKQTKREALQRSGLLCEAVGVMYGLDPRHRCNAPLGYGVEFDHVILDANSKDNSLENCAAVCIKCHKWKTAKHDTPLAAKTVRQRDKLGLGIKSRSTFPKKPEGYKHDWKTGRLMKKSLGA